MTHSHDSYHTTNTNTCFLCTPLCIIDFFCALLCACVFCALLFLIGTALLFLIGTVALYRGLLDWFEVDLGFTELLFIQIDLCVVCVFCALLCGCFVDASFVHSAQRTLVVWRVCA